MSSQATTTQNQNPLEELQDLAGYDTNGNTSPIQPAIYTPPHIQRVTHSYTNYQNATLSPWVLIVSAIVENRRYTNAAILPQKLYVSDQILEQLPRDMQICIEEEFNGESIPFTLLSGEKVYIPIFSAKLPRHEVLCLNHSF